MRADAQQNVERLLVVAARAFARDGARATLKDIAKEAGVGIGTLYRHFPDRRSLVDAVYRSETARVCDAAAGLLALYGPVDALRRWTVEFLDYMATKEGMAEALQAILRADEPRRLETRERIREALALLIDAGKETGDFRPELGIDDVMLALGGFALIVDYQQSGAEAAERLVRLLLTGLLRPPA